MAITPQITSLASSGVYSFEFDKSQVTSIPAAQVRLIIGFSKEGPFNTPIFCEDTGYFQDVFGSIDRTLERKGSYFHRTCLAALERGPILALNLLKLNDDIESGNADYAESITYSTSSTSVNPPIESNLFSGYFNKDKFWFPEDESFLNNIQSTENNIINFVNVKNKPITLITRKTDTTILKGFDITAKEWYGVDSVPEFMHPDDFISDYMIDVIVISGDFGSKSTDTTPYERLASDPLFASYFDKSKGIKRKLSVTDFQDTSLEAFLNLPEVNHLATYTGCLIPDFIDLNGNNLFIQDIINAETSKTGLFCAINKEMFDTGELLSAVDGGIDLIGHNIEFEQPKTIDFLSYKETIKSDLNYSKSSVTLKTISDTSGITPTVASSGNILISVDLSTNSTFYNIVASQEFRENEASPRVVGSYLLADNGEFVPVVTKQVTATTALIEVSAEGSITETSFDTAIAGNDLKYVNYTDLTYLVDQLTGAPTDSIVAAYSSQFYSDIENGIITTGDKILWDANGSGDAQSNEVGYIRSQLNTTDTIVYDSLYLTGDISDTSYPIPVAVMTAYNDDDFTSQMSFDFSEVFFDSDDTAGSADELIIQTLKGSLNNTIPATATSISNVIEVSTDYAEYIEVGKYIVSSDGGTSGPSRLTKIVSVSQDGNTLTVTTVSKILFKSIGGVSTVEVYDSISNWSDYYTLTSLNGFTHNSYHLPDGTQEKLDTILSMIVGTNLKNALIDKENINFRYIVDTFGLGIQAFSKYQLFQLAKDRQNAFAIVNAPSIKNFKDSTNPSFVDLTGAVNAKMITEGGDLSKNPKIRYTLPGIPQGSNYGAYFSPYLVVRDRGKNITVPPAGYVSNNYIDKYTNSLPWSVVAGARRGVIAGSGLVGIEYNYSREDRDYLEPFGINPIIFQTGVGIVIFGNKTAQQNVKSALSSAHAREVLIYIEDGIANILKNYVFEVNTPQTRLEIKTLADNFLRQVQAEDGIYDFKNIMDETNNTSDIIDRNTGIIDTYIEITKALEVLVHRTTILRTGAISTGEYL